jgi:hypothetical protein
MQSPIYRQMSLEEFLFQTNVPSALVNKNTTNTKTYAHEVVSEHFKSLFDLPKLVEKLSAFNESTASLHEQERSDLYTTFHIPKRSGGLRRIDAPKPELMDALRRLKTIFEEDFHALYHTSSFAYVKGRSTIDAVKRHQKNESKWFGKYDLSNFFGSTTLDFVLRQFGMIFPFSEVLRYQIGRSELTKALELAFLNGGLPQGTPISPLITNLMMIPIDFKLSNGLRSFENQNYVYTRYADDFIVSSRYNFDVKEVERKIAEVITEFSAPFTINPEKTRYGSSAGRNWNLGVMLNKDNEITVGHKRKRQFQVMLHNYIMDRRNGTPWDIHDIQVMKGLHSYYHMIEPNAISNIVAHTNGKMGVDVMRLIKEDLS